MLPSSPAASPVVLVLDANQRSALAVTRSLGMRGVTVLTSDSTTQALAGSSRYSQRYLLSPSPATSPTAFLDWLEQTVKAEGITYIQPVTEVSSQLILRHRERLPTSCLLPFANLDTVMMLADKGRLTELAGAASVPCPATQWFKCGRELDPDRISDYPVVLKPCLSRVFLGDRWLDTAVAIVHNREELVRLLKERVEFREHPFLVQEFIPGSGAGVFALYDQGRPITFFAHRRLREKPPQGGVSVLSEAVPLDEATLAAAQRLLSHAQWHGAAMVEFRVSPDGTPFLMEVNTRFWGSLQLAIDAGVDFPWLLYQLSHGHAVNAPDHYQPGCRLRWWLGDVDSLYLFLRDRRHGFRAKLRRLLAFLIPHPFRTRHEVFRWHDPGPAWLELKVWLQALRA